MGKFAGAALAAMVMLVVFSQRSDAQEPQQLIYGLKFEQLEYRFGDQTDVTAWDGDLWVGTDEWKFRGTSEGEYAREGRSFETLEHQLFVQRMVSTFFDAKLGVRRDNPDEFASRTYGVVGVHGLAPQWFEIDADFFVSENGDASARLAADYELLLTNWIILTPTLELDFAFSDDKAAGVGSGFSKAEIGARLSYDLIDRSLSPYIGVHYERKFGETGRIARSEGEGKADVFFAIGTRLMF